MDILTQKRITDNGDGRGYFRNCIEYAFKEKSEENEALIQVKGYGVSGRSPENAYNQMYNVKEYYGKTGDNPVMHFVVSYDRSTVTEPQTACEYTDKIADYFKDRYQMITAIHQEDQGNSLYHAHIIMNSVDYNTGKLYHSGLMNLNSLQCKFMTLPEIIVKNALRLHELMALTKIKKYCNFKTNMI